MVHPEKIKHDYFDVDRQLPCAILHLPHFLNAVVSHSSTLLVPANHPGTLRAVILIIFNLIALYGEIF